MKKHLLPLIVSLGLAGTALLQAAETIKLDQPDLTRGSAVMKALSDRQSIRSCSDKMLSQKDLSDLVWAANGINRADSGKRTAPSAMNRQDVKSMYAPRTPPICTTTRRMPWFPSATETPGRPMRPSASS